MGFQLVPKSMTMNGNSPYFTEFDRLDANYITAVQGRLIMIGAEYPLTVTFWPKLNDAAAA